MPLLNWIKNIFAKKKHYDEEILEGIDIEDINDDAQSFQAFAKRIKSAQEEIQLIRPDFEQVIDAITTLQKIEDLSSSSIKSLEKLAGLYSETIIQKENYQKIVQNQGNESQYLEEYVDELSKVIKNIKEHEDQQRLVKQDIHYLEGEKGELLYNRERYIRSMTFVKGALISLSVLAALVVFVLTTMFFVYNRDIFMPSIIALVSIIFFGTWIYIFRRYMIHEQKKNGRHYKRAIELLNKTKLKYVKNQQFLDYEYSKYRVNSSEMLQLRYESYEKNLRNKNRYESITNNIASIIIDIEDMFKKVQIGNVDYVIDNIDYFVSKKARKLLKTSLEEKQNDLKQTISRNEREIEILSKIIKGSEADYES